MDLFNSVDDGSVSMLPHRHHAILLIGPNASGKTTAVREGTRDWAGDPRVLAIYADTEKAYKTDPATVEYNFLTVWESPTAVLVIDGTDRSARALHRVIAASRRTPPRTLDVHVTVVDPMAMRAHLAARCARSGRTFNAPYWTDEKCVYEGTRRYRNMASRSFPEAQLWTIGEAYLECGQLVRTIQAQIQAALDAD